MLDGMRHATLFILLIMYDLNMDDLNTFMITTSLFKELMLVIM